VLTWLVKDPEVQRGLFDRASPALEVPGRAVSSRHRRILLVSIATAERSRAFRRRMTPLLFAPVTSVARHTLGMEENVGTLHQRPSTAPRPMGAGRACA
jgi:hypothetical protein